MSIYSKFKDWLRLQHYRWFRYKGFHPYEIWNLNTAIAKFVAPRLRIWIEAGVNGVPQTFINDMVPIDDWDEGNYDIDELGEKWKDCLKNILNSLEIDAKGEDWKIPFNTPEMEMYLKGLEDFGKYWDTLWD